jgi:hypothetical protein
MTALARNLSLFPGTALTLSITTPTGSVAVQVRMTKQLSQEHFDSIEVSLTDSAALAAAGSERHRPERDLEGDAYGENGERMPYYPARPRELPSGVVAGALPCPSGVGDPDSRASRHED